MRVMIRPGRGILLGMACFCAIGCGESESAKPADTVLVPKAEYQELQRRAELEKKYEATFALRREVLRGRRRGDKVFRENALFNACGDVLDPNGEIYDPKNWPDAPVPSGEEK